MYSTAARKHGLSFKILLLPMSNNRLIRMMETMSERYGVRSVFCRPDQTGEMIIKLLTGGG